MPPEIKIVEQDDRRWWPIVVSVGTSVASAVLSAALCITISQRAVDGERRAREDASAERTRAAAANLHILCQLVVTQENVFKDAQSQVGRNAAKAWHDLGIIYGCYKE